MPLLPASVPESQGVATAQHEDKSQQRASPRLGDEAKGDQKGQGRNGEDWLGWFAFSYGPFFRGCGLVPDCGGASCPRNLADR